MRNIYEIEENFIYLGSTFIKDGIIKIVDMSTVLYTKENNSTVISLAAYSDCFKNDCYDTVRFIFDNKKYLVRRTIKLK